MASSSRDAVTELLVAAQDGDAQAFDALYERVYQELRRLAHVVRQGRAGATLNTTALVHEAYFKLIPSQNLDWQDRAHFFRIAARAMRQVLINTARERMAQKRGGGQLRVTLNEHVDGAVVQADQLVALDEALQQLEAFHPRQAQVVECRFFAGLSVEETAHALSVSTPTIKRDWRTARAWLADALKAA